VQRNTTAVKAHFQEALARKDTHLSQTARKSCGHLLAVFATFISQADVDVMMTTIAKGSMLELKRMGFQKLVRLHPNVETL
jgi:hypothetical protein